MTLKTLLEEMTSTLGTVGIAFFISVLLCIAFYSLGLRMYYMSVGVPNEASLTSNKKHDNSQYHGTRSDSVYCGDNGICKRHSYWYN